METELKNLIELRTKKLDPETHDDRWLWPKVDTGAYAGPFTDWESSHRHKYFQNLKDNKLIVTAGANMGVHVRAYARKFDEVYAFEPHWLNFYCMSYNAPYNNVHKFNCALGKDVDRVFIKNDPQNNMGAYKTDVNHNEQGRTIPMLTIDILKLPACSMIQLDVEGAEFEILQGAVKTIEKYHPVIITENHKKELEEFLFARGYQFQNRSISDSIYFHKG